MKPGKLLKYSKINISQIQISFHWIQINNANHQNCNLWRNFLNYGNRNLIALRENTSTKCADNRPESIWLACRDFKVWLIRKPITAETLNCDLHWICCQWRGRSTRILHILSWQICCWTSAIHRYTKIINFYLVFR